MRTMSRRFVSKSNGARKAVAIVASAALVASMSNFQAFAAPISESEASAQEKVTVCFELDPGVTVDFKGTIITSDSEDKTVQVNTGRDYTFKVRASSVDKKAYIVKGVTYMFASPKTEPKPIAEKTQEKEIQQAEENVGEKANQSVQDGSGTTGSGVQQEGDGSAENQHEGTAGAGVGMTDESQADPASVASLADEEEKTSSTENGGEAQGQGGDLASTEAIDGDETPMASPESQKDRELSEAQEVVSNGNGSYTLTEASIGEAAETDRDIVIELTSDEIGDETVVSNGDDLKRALESEGNVKVVLDAAVEDKIIEVREGIVVKKNKVLELNGVNLVASLDGDASFLTVPNDARLEITDEASKYIEPTGVLHETTTGNGKYAPDNIAKLGSYNAESKMLTYSVSKSKTHRATGTTEEYRDTYTMDLSSAGAITSSGVNALVKVEAGGNFVMEGGRLTNTGGKHGVEAQGNSRVTISGGFIVGNGAKANGAGIYVDGAGDTATLNINGKAVVGGNVADEPHNGGGVYLNRCNATIGGQAVIAGNYASRGNAVVTKNNDATSANNRNLIQESNGGGVYLSSNVALTLSGEAAVVSNRAARDGGGIYANASKGNALGVPSNSLTIEGEGEGVNLSNNEASHDMTDLNPGFKDGKGQTRDWRMTPMGGGAIFSMGNLKINGAAQLVNNKSGDAGGAIMLPQVGGYAAASLKIEEVVVAGNYAQSSEGGGIWCQPKSATKHEDNAGSDAATKDDFSYIKGGYITNNASGTVFDFGGGGLYVNKDGYLCLYNPLVTGNTAYGWGGGVAGCHNGFVLSNKIAMFGNTAKQEGYTSNDNEYADRWAYHPDYLDGQNGKLEAGASNDFFTGRESTVQDKMLGGGSHNWTGYTTGRGVQATFERIEWNSAKLTLQIAGGETEEIKLFSTNFESKEEKDRVNAFAYIPNSVNYDDVSKKILHSVAEFKGTFHDGLGFITFVEKRPDADAPGYYKIHMKIDRSVAKPAGDGGQILDQYGKVFEDALVYHGSFQSDLSQGSIDSGQEVLQYNVYKIATEEGSDPDAPVVSKFPKGGQVHTKRFLALNANPTEDAKKAAFKEACVFISGNYSRTNGGGIANNGYIDLGSPKGTDGNKPDPTEFDLTLKKNWEGFDKAAENQGTFTAIFRIRAYESKGAYDFDKNKGTNENCKFETIRALTYAPGESAHQTLKVEDIEKGSYVVVEEMDVSGDNFTGAVVANGVLDGNGGLTVTSDKTVTFDNTYSNDKSYGTGVVNSYTKGDAGDANASGVQVTQDNLYKKNRPIPAGEGALTNPTDPLAGQAAGE